LKAQDFIFIGVLCIHPIFGLSSRILLICVHTYLSLDSVNKKTFDFHLYNHKSISD